MRRHILISILVPVVALFVTGSVLGDKLEEAEKKITEARAKHKSVQTKSKTTQEFKSEQMEMKSETVGTQEYRKKDGRYLLRVEMKTKGTQKIKGQPDQKIDTTVLMIDDGKFLYTLNTMGTSRTATKMKRNPDMFEGKAYFKQLRKHFTLKLLPDEKVDGKDAYVIETKPKTDNPATSKAIYYFDKKTGIDLKMVSYDGKGKAVMTTVTTDVKLNAEIKDDRFVFKAPEGVQVADMTKMGQQEQEPTPSKEEKATTEAPEEEPKPEEKKKKKRGLGGLFDKLK